jgi:hypothetical protein
VRRVATSAMDVGSVMSTTNTTPSLERTFYAISVGITSNIRTLNEAPLLPVNV